MPDTPQLLPVGYEVVEENGTAVVRKRDDAKLTKSVSFRLSTPAYNRLILFGESFPDSSLTTAMRWLLEQPSVSALISERIQAAT